MPLPTPARLTRRALFAAAGLVAAGGAATAFRGSSDSPAVVARGHRSRLPPAAPRAADRQPAPAPPPPAHASDPPRHRHASAGQHDHHRKPDHHQARHHGHRHDEHHHGHHGDDHQHANHHHHDHAHDHHAGGHDQGKAKHHRREEHVDLPPPKVRVRSHPIYSVADIDLHPPHKAIALTIDDGPDPDWTPKVLRLLDKYRMQVSFCVVGIHADVYPRLVRDIHRAGHVIVNHSYTHVQPFAQQSEKRIVAEITRTQRAIEKAAKVTPELFRSPGGDWSHFLFRAVAAYGLTPLDWDVDPRDWARPGRRRIQRRMLRSKPGDIVLCHDGGGDRAETVRALRRVLPDWKHRGYTTIPLVLPK